MHLLRVLFVVVFAGTSCSREPSSARPTSTAPADTNVRALADAYVNGLFDRFPEQAIAYGVPGRSHDRLTDNSPAALQRWQAPEDEEDCRADVQDQRRADADAATANGSAIHVQEPRRVD